MIVFELIDVKLCPVNKRKVPGVFKKAGKTIPYAYTPGEYKKSKEFLVNHFKANCDIGEFAKIDQKNVKIAIMSKQYADIDAYEKIILDALEEAGIIENDRYVMQVVKDKETIKRGHPQYFKIMVG